MTTGPPPPLRVDTALLLPGPETSPPSLASSSFPSTYCLTHPTSSTSSLPPLPFPSPNLSFLTYPSLTHSSFSHSLLSRLLKSLLLPTHSLPLLHTHSLPLPLPLVLSYSPLTTHFLSLIPTSSLSSYHTLIRNPFTLPFIHTHSLHSLPFSYPTPFFILTPPPPPLPPSITSTNTPSSILLGESLEPHSLPFFGLRKCLSPSQV